MAPDLSKFKAAQAVAVNLKLVGGIGGDQVVTITYAEGKFTADTGVVGGPLGQVFLLDQAQQQQLHDALRQELHHAPPSIDVSVLQMFIHQLSRQPSTLFDQARFADISTDASGVVTAHVGQGVDIVGTIVDDHGAIKYEQHPVPMKPHQLHQLPPSDRASLAAALTKFIAD